MYDCLCLKQCQNSGANPSYGRVCFEILKWQTHIQKSVNSKRRGYENCNHVFRLKIGQLLRKLNCFLSIGTLFGPAIPNYRGAFIRRVTHNRQNMVRCFTSHLNQAFNKSGKNSFFSLLAHKNLIQSIIVLI